MIKHNYIDHVGYIGDNNGYPKMPEMVVGVSKA